MCLIIKFLLIWFYVIPLLQVWVITTYLMIVEREKNVTGITMSMFTLALVPVINVFVLVIIMFFMNEKINDKKTNE